MEHIKATDTAKLIRKALKEAFADTKFSVRTSKYSGGASINIKWTDGPNEKQVKAVANRFSGATFDGMQDLKEYHGAMLDGREVHFGADFVFTDREYSREHLKKARDRVAQKYAWVDAKNERVEAPELEWNERGMLANTQLMQHVWVQNSADYYNTFHMTMLRKAESLSCEAASDSPTARRVA